jgi:hypothetical protein
MFTSSLLLERNPTEEVTFTVARDFTYQSLDTTITVHQGYRTDGASVPKCFWSLLDPYSGRYLCAAVIHDGLYNSHHISKTRADRIFLEAMLEVGVNHIKAYCMYYAVKWFGHHSWNDVSEKKIQVCQTFFVSVSGKDGILRIY